MSETDRFLTVAEAAERMRVQPKTMTLWIRKGLGPAPIGEGRDRRISVALAAWIHDSAGLIATWRK
ncbi:MAG: helix-turn-helix domain-containing protein, partial [Mycobacterium sp.]